MEKLQFLPFFRLHSEALRTMLGLKDNRSILNWLKEKGIKIRGSGKDAYILTDEALEALKKEEEVHSSYVPSKKYW